MYFSVEKSILLEAMCSHGISELFIFRSPIYPDTPDEKISKQEQIRMIHLRSHLNELTEKVKHHQYLTEKTRYSSFSLLIFYLSHRSR